jgi:hypothetical protein
MSTGLKITISTKQKDKKKWTSLNIIKSNKYETQTLNKICNKREKQEQDNRRKKWARFTYMGKETRYITGASHKGVNEVMPVVTAELCVSGRSAQ